MVRNSVLIVDDTPANLKLVRVLLSRHGFEVRTASTAEEALEVAQSFQPQLVLADIQLPGMDGLEMTRCLKSAPATRHTVVLALTAFGREADEQKAFEAGCDGYISKPIDTRKFPDLIRGYLARSKGAAANEPSSGPAANRATHQEVRQAFLADGVRQSSMLISTLGSNFDTVEARNIVRKWALSAAFPEISHYARELEALLEQNARGSPVRTRELLVRLARMFAEATA